MRTEWRGFKGNKWQSEVNLRDFIQNNYTSYDGDESFLAEPTQATDTLWGMLQELQKQERAKGGVLDMETEVVSGLTAYGAAYIGEGTKDLEKVVGLQTDKPLKRAFMPYGGIKMAEQACTTYGYEPSAKLHEIFHNYCKTHNDGVFDAYTPEMKHVRHNHILTGLPDTYGRGRIVGDYRRVALYGIDFLIAEKQKDLAEMGDREMIDEVIRLREEVAMQIKALKGLKEMAASYGFDISQPAQNAREAVQWLYFGYLGAVKTQNGAAMSVGRISTFLDIYFERDFKEGTLTEADAQELIDHLVMKFRMVKFARIPSYNQLFSGDPVWATLEVGGMGQDGRSKEMQFFGARANLAKCLTYAISGGVDSKTREQCGPKYRAIEGDVVTYEEFMPRFMDMMDWLASVYVKTLNLIHYMHDKYFYEAEEMALIDTDVRRTFATGIAGFSHVVDSISAIKYAKVNIIRDETGFPLSFQTEGDFPRYGNDDERADEIAVWLLKTFMSLIKKYHTYRDSEPTTSILTITSNVVYGKYTSNMPDGRPAGAPLAPGANPSYGAEKNGLLASLNSVAKLPYEYALDGISNTQTISPGALGHDDEERANTLVGVMDGYFNQGAHHLNVNVFGVEKLKDAMEHPEKEEYQNFTIRVSGYAVKFIDLTREQQLDVIARQAHEKL